MTGNVKISDLTTATVVNDAAVLPFAFSGTTYKITYTNFKTDLLSDLDFVESTGAATTDSQLMVASGTGGDTIKPSAASGILKQSANVVSAATAGIDYISPTGTETMSNKTFSSPVLIQGNTGAPSSPTAGTLLQIAGADATVTRAQFDTYDALFSMGGRRANGTQASKTGLVLNDVITQIGAHGYDSSGAYQAGVRASINLAADGTWTSTSAPTRITLATTTAASTTVTTRFNIGSAGGLYAEGLADTGIGTVNVNAVQAPTYNGGALAGFRNAIINGNFNIWQRGTSFSSPASGTFTADRWYVNYDGTGAFNLVRNGNAARIDNTNAEGYQFQWEQTGAIGGGCTFRQVRQKIEKVATFAGKTVNLSFKMWAAIGSGNFSVTVTQSFGTGGSPSANVDTSVIGTTALTNTGYTQYSASVAIPSIVGKTLGTSGTDALEIVFQLPITGTYDIRIMDVQLETGSVRTEFEQRPIATELALCQRYFEKSFAQSIAPAQNTGSLLGAPTATGQVLNQRFGCYVPFKVTKRTTTPVITTFSPNAVSANWQTNGTTPTVAVATIGDNGFYIAGTTAVTAGNDYAIHWTAGAEL